MPNPSPTIQKALDLIDAVAQELQRANLPATPEYGTRGIWLMMARVREAVSTIEREILHG